MVYIHDKKLIFIRIPKNASTSLATFFIRGYAGNRDTYTGVGDSSIKTNNIDPKTVAKYRKGYRFIHLTLQELVDEEIIPKEAIENSKVIGCIREPLDRQLSLYFFKRRNSIDRISPEDFRHMFANGYCNDDNNNEILQSDYLKYNGNDYGEYWLYDDLDTHVNQFVQEYPPRKSTNLPRYKSKLREGLDKEKMIKEYYDDKTRDAVMSYFEKDFELYESLKK